MEFLNPVLQGLLVGAGAMWLYLQLSGLTRQMNELNKKLDKAIAQNNYYKGART